MEKYSRILLLSLLLLCGSGLWAQTLVPCVVVEQTDGTLSEYLLTSTPRITYAADVVTLTATDATLALPVADVKKVYLSQTEKGTDGIRPQQQTATPRVQLTADGLRLSGLAAGSPVTVYARRRGGPPRAHPAPLRRICNPTPMSISICNAYHAKPCSSS